MPALNFVDRYSSTVNSAYTSGGTSLVVASASGLPSGACNFYIIVQKEGANTEEVFQVTNVSGTTLTVAGAQAGTSASNHASGAVVIGSIMTVQAFKSMGPLLLQTQVASNSAALNFTCITADYDDYTVKMDNLTPATGGVELWMEVSTDGGSSYDTGANYDYVLWYYNGVSAPTGQTHVLIANALLADADYSVNGEFDLYNPLGANYKHLKHAVSTYVVNSSTIFIFQGISNYKSHTAVNAFRLRCSSGNIASGTARCYGWGK